MRVHVVFGLLGALALGGCFSPRQAAPPSRETPAGTVEMFKQFARRGDPAGEWDILSPDLKRRLGQQAGRTIDLADYTAARQAYRNDPRVRAAENLLQTAIVRQTQPTGPDRVMATVVTSGGPLARSANLQMVRLTKWELSVNGQAEPYWGFTSDPLFGADRQSDGSYVVWYRQDPNGARSEQRIPASDVRNYHQTSAWYVDDLGGLESQFLQ